MPSLSHCRFALAATAGMLAWCHSALAQAQGELSTGMGKRHEQLVVRAPTGVTPEAERLLAASAEPRRLELRAGEDLFRVARRSCGRLTSTYVELLKAANSGTMQGETKSGGDTVIVPACFVARPNEPVRVDAGETWAELARRTTGIAGPQTLNALFVQAGETPKSGQAVWAAADAAIPGTIGELIVPMATEGVAYAMRPGTDQGGFTRAMEIALNVPQTLAGQVVQTDELTLEAGVEDVHRLISRCPATPRTRASWPFDVIETAAVIKRNEGYYGSGSVGNAIVAVVDNGVDGLMGAAFPEEELSISRMERNAPNDGRDQDGNGFADDVVGANIYDDAAQRHGPVAFPNLKKNPAHGTMMASLALGGPEFRLHRRQTGAPAHVLIRAVGIVRREIVVGANGNEERFSMPTDAIGRAINYAEAGGATIVNLSVSTPFRRAEIEDALYNRSNLLLVVAAGNSAHNLNVSNRYPAAHSSDDSAFRGRVVTVAAHDRSDCMSGFSGHGDEVVDIAAPGENILSTVLGGGEALDDGTSQATALTSFTAAQLRAAGLDHAGAIKERLMASVDISPVYLGRVRSQGALNIPKALSISDDVLELDTGSGLSFGRLSVKPTVGAVCPALAGDMRDVLKLSRRIDGGVPGEVRLVARKRETRAKLEFVHCVPTASPVDFTDLGGTAIRFQWSEVQDIVPRI